VLLSQGILDGLSCHRLKGLRPIVGARRREEACGADEVPDKN
jgi:hypothetical protein